MLGVPQWVWLGVAIIVVYRAGQWAMVRGFRKLVRSEFIRYAGAIAPDLGITSAGERRLRFHTGDGEVGTYDLVPLYTELAAQADMGGQTRSSIYWEHLKRLHGQLGSGRPILDLEKHGDRIRPRVVGPAAPDEVARPANIPRTPIGDTGLGVVYCLENGPQGRLLIDDDMARELGLDSSGLHARAIANLRANFPVEAVRQVATGEQGTVFKLGDGYDTGRLLLIPEHLQDGEAIAVAIPDPNSLILLPIPDDGDWSKLRQAAVTPLGPGRPPLDGLLRVTREAIERA